LEKCQNKVKKIKELSPKQKSSLNKKNYQLSSFQDRKTRQKEKDKENIRSLSPAESKYTKKRSSKELKSIEKVKSTERSTSINNSARKSVENIYSDPRKNKKYTENRESLVTFGERTDRLKIQKESVMSESDAIRMKLKEKLKAAYSQAQSKED